MPTAAQLLDMLDKYGTGLYTVKEGWSCDLSRMPGYTRSAPLSAEGYTPRDALLEAWKELKRRERWKQNYHLRTKGD
jgi:hypothetical protein